MQVPIGSATVRPDLPHPERSAKRAVEGRTAFVPLALGVALALLGALPASAEAPTPSAVTPELTAAAAKEGKVTFYTSIELELAQKIGHAFEAKYPAIAVTVERNGAERIYQRIFQEYGSDIHVCDVVESSDASHLLDYKRKGMLAAYVPQDVTRWPAAQRDLGWAWFEQLAKQNIMQVQSSADPPKKLDLGERAVMADGNEYNIFQLKEKGRPVEPVYATEGSPLIIGPNGIFKGSPNPNAAKLFQSFCFSRDAQQLIIDVGGLRSVHPQTQEKPGRTPFKDIKTMKDDAAAVEREGDAIKAHYSKLFHV
jgi:ABC-type Fe3+ transport system substrate-binding protein